MQANNRESAPVDSGGLSFGLNFSVPSSNFSNRAGSISDPQCLIRKQKSFLDFLHEAHHW